MRGEPGQDRPGFGIAPCKKGPCDIVSATDHLKRIVAICLQDWLDTDPRFFAIRYEAEAALRAIEDEPEPCLVCGLDRTCTCP